MTIVRKYIWALDGDYEIFGWRPLRMPSFNVSRNGVGIAHDTLEHHSATDTSIEAEWRAFGAMLYLRAEPDYWKMYGQHTAKYNDPAFQMSGDVARFIHESIESERRPADPGRTLPLSDDLEATLADICNLARTELLHDMDISREVAEHDLKVVVGWMRRGYRQAARRWGMDDWRRAEMFNEMARRVDELGYEHLEGTTMSISIVPGDIESTIKLTKPRYAENYD